MRKYILICLSFLVSFGAFAQVDDADIERSLLWKIEGEDIQTSYIFGTIHIIGSNDFVWSDKLSSYISGAERVVFEIKMDDEALQKKAMEFSALKDTTIAKLLSEEDFMKADTFFRDNLKMPLAGFNQIKPIVLTTMFYPFMVNGELMSYENELISLATELNKEINGLETIDFQLGLFDIIPLNEQVTMFMNMVNDFEKNKQNFQQLANAYTTQDVDALYQYMIENLDEYEKYESEFISDRNMDWIRKIIEYAKEPTFFAFGAGHLGGERGIIQLLRENGLTVTPVGLSME